MIYNHDYNRQCINFDGLEHGGIGATDIDGLIEIQNRAFVVFEIKHIIGEVPKGQRLALQRMVDCFELAGRKAVAFICEHDVPVGQDIDASSTIVRELYQGRTWYNVKQLNNTLSQMYDRFCESIGIPHRSD